MQQSEKYKMVWAEPRLVVEGRQEPVRIDPADKEILDLQLDLSPRRPGPYSPRREHRRKAALQRKGRSAD